MFAIIGLGNPGEKYKTTRHNIGFMACDYWLKSLGGQDYREEHKSYTKKFKYEGHDVILVKPQTYMNNSGEAVVSVVNFYKIEPNKILVIHDEIDLAFGSMRFHFNRGSGGQNGVKSISQLLGHNQYTRLKLGIGRPTHPSFEISDYVLGNFSKEEAQHLDMFLQKACDATESFITEGLNKASTKFNGAVKFHQE